MDRGPIVHIAKVAFSYYFPLLLGAPPGGICHSITIRQHEKGLEIVKKLGGGERINYKPHKSGDKRIL